MSGNWLMESRSFLAGLLVETSQQAFRRENAMNGARTASHYVGIHHHVCQASVAIERMVEMKLNDGLLLTIG